MPALADTRLMPLATAAAVYEANGADADFMGQWTGTTALAQLEWMRDYRAATESVMDEGFAVLCIARSLAATLAAATQRISETQFPRLARVALDALTAIHADLTAPDCDPHEGPHLVLLLALEDTCEGYGVITPAERTTCATHRAPAAECCA
ncbi:hypothetical protein [Streptomyces sp. S1D4-20]|uniref:hypothetical protein n=1 Tax=Streptomyces sp. S1D4-20 TaxID=2594462 RepID=UPI001165C24D|nr:hypothetical protein [Streptomyces sp. S1D4-20]QDN54059.1 hypothetical protein FNV67_00320 [Streptomyces sp. S1D4-20]